MKAESPNVADFILGAHVTAVNRDQDGALVYTVKIEGSPVTYQMERNSSNFSLGLGLHTSGGLHVGNHKARWKDTRILEVLFLNDKGKEDVEQLRVVGEQSQKD